MTIHPILLRALLTAVVAEIGDEQRETLTSGTTTARIAAEDRLVDDLMAAIATADRGGGADGRRVRHASPSFRFIATGQGWFALGTGISPLDCPYGSPSGGKSSRWMRWTDR
ncbi:hypothetical protein IP65_09780 [Novosphingobium sp. AAP1]|nr:hypothetical protein IP65_09780 [Novosphingobium sp. AAP1]